MLKHISNRTGKVWFGFSLVSFTVFMIGLIILISNVMDTVPVSRENLKINNGKIYLGKESLIEKETIIKTRIDENGNETEVERKTYNYDLKELVKESKINGLYIWNDTNDDNQVDSKELDDENLFKTANGRLNLNPERKTNKIESETSDGKNKRMRETRILEEMHYQFTITLDEKILGKKAESAFFLDYGQKYFGMRAPILGFLLVILGVACLFLGITKTIENTKDAFRRTFREPGTAYIYIGPAIIGMVILVFFPLVFGIWVAFTNYARKVPLYKIKFPEFMRFIEVFTSKNSDFWDIFFINIWWTIINIIFAVALGVGLAIVLNRSNMRLKKLYRTLLILPWAIPSYVTALMWRAIFQQKGPANQILEPIYDLFGVESLKWLSQSYISLAGIAKIPVIGPMIVNVIGLKGFLISLPFIAVVIVNIWLGYPFMMVVALGGLQSISDTYYEAAEIDGASKWEQFKFITAPLLKPTMVPAIILSIIWTFNQFNVIYLITDETRMSILVVSAYREAFEKGRYSYAAAYSVIIFIILAGYSIFTMKMSKATEEVF